MAASCSLKQDQQDRQCSRKATGEPVQRKIQRKIQKSRKKSGFEEVKICYLCNQEGHIKRSCPLQQQTKKSSLEPQSPHQLAQHSAKPDTSIQQLSGQPQQSKGRMSMPQNHGHGISGEEVEEKVSAVVDGEILYCNLEAKFLIDTSAMLLFFCLFPRLVVIDPCNSGATLQLIYMFSSPDKHSLYLIGIFSCSFSHRTVMSYCIF